ncbi:UNVERIFIED_CONTAM: hypothetical protein Sradi_4119700 [Sesamum radiatum]|uniref:Uncharacterized protein n=1 Tax=Sesamum radiatum TaxID=300843 RepID=A0AAW2P3I9_SESRA
MSTGPPLLPQIPCLLGGPRPPVIKRGNTLLLVCLGHPIRGRDIVLLLSLLVAPHDIPPLSLPPLLLLLLLGLRSRLFKSLHSPAGGLYDYVMLMQEKEGASSQDADILKGTLTSADKHLMTSLSWEDLDKMLSLVLAKVNVVVGVSHVLSYLILMSFASFGFCILGSCFMGGVFVMSSRRVCPGIGRCPEEEIGRSSRTPDGRGGQTQRCDKRSNGEVPASREGDQEALEGNKCPEGRSC